jgi:glycosyltransferase involved in cell wall biosynthesis
MHIAYDGSGLTPPRTGVGNYIHDLLSHLLCIDRANTYWLMAHRRTYVDDWSGGLAQTAGVHFPNRLFWMQCVLPWWLRRLRPDVAHFTNAVAPLLSSAKTVLTIHDLSLLLYPHLYRPRERVVQRPFVSPSVRRAHALITVSHTGKAEIVRVLGVAPDRVHVIHEAAASCFYAPQDPAERDRRLAAYGWDACARNILYVGRLEPRKNCKRLVEAFALLQRREPRARLWLVGLGGLQTQSRLAQIRALGLEGTVHLPGYVPAADLRAFYGACQAFVFPSVYEGFGLPVVEAMACGAPVLLSDLAIFREIGGDAALYFNPHSAEQIAALLERVLSEPGLAADLRLKARRRAAQFSWERAARETLAIYAAVANA